MSWRALVGKTVRAGLDRVPIPVWEICARRRVSALCYHMVSDDTLPHVRPLFAYKTSHDFARDLEYLQRRYLLVSEERLARRLEDREAGRAAELTVTFDDGLTECHSVVRPILARLGARAVFFLTTGCLDNRSMIYRHQAALCLHRIQSAVEQERAGLFEAVRRGLRDAPADVPDLVRLIKGLRADRTSLLDEIAGRLGVDVTAYLDEHRPYLSRAQALDLAGDGHILGAHGVTHREFQVLTDREIEREVVESCEAVLSLTGRTPVPFAVPFTLDGLDRAVLQRVRRAHPEIGWIYGTSGFQDEPHGLFNRLVADAPPGSRNEFSNLPRLFGAAYASWALAAMRSGRQRP